MLIIINLQIESKVKRACLNSAAFSFFTSLKIFILKCNLGIFKHPKMINSCCATGYCYELKDTLE